MSSLEEDEVIGGSKASGVIQAIMANKEDYLSKLTPRQLNIVGEHFGVDKKVRRKDGRDEDGVKKRKYVRQNHSALQIKEQVGSLQEINDFIKERFPNVRPNRPYKLSEDLKTDFPDGRNQLASKNVLEKGAEEGKEDYEENLRIYNILPPFYKNTIGRDPDREKDPYTMINTNAPDDYTLAEAIPEIFKKSKTILKYLLNKGISITDYDGLVKRLPLAYSEPIYRDLDTIKRLLKFNDDESFFLPESYEEFKEANEEDPDEGFPGIYNENKDFARAMDFAFALQKLYGLKEDDTFASLITYPPPEPVIDAEDYLDWVDESGIGDKYYENDYIQGTTREGVFYSRMRQYPRLMWRRREDGSLYRARDAFPFAPFDAKRKGEPLIFRKKKVREPPGGFTDRDRAELRREEAEGRRRRERQDIIRRYGLQGMSDVVVDAFENILRRRRGMRGRGAPPERAFWKGAKYAYDKVAPNVIGDGYVKIVDTPTFDAYLRRADKSILLASRGTNITSWGDLKADAQLVANRLRKTNRYARDVGVLRQIIAKYPPEDGYEYYIAGHSLSVAIANQLMRDFPFIKKAVGYNGAFQPADLAQQNPDIKRLYTDKDFLYNLGGKMFRNVKVIPMTETKAKGFFGRITSAFTPSGIKGHSLDNFKPLYGLGMKGRGAELVRRVQARKVGGRVGGASFKKGDSPNLLEKIAFAPGRNQGEIKRIKNWWKDIIKNEVDFSVERAISIMRKGAGPNGVPSAFMVRRFLEQQKHQGDKPIYDKFIGKVRELESVEDQAVGQGGEAMAKYAVAIQLLITQIVKFLRKDLNQSISAVKRRNAQLQEEERKYQERLAGFRKGWVFGTAYVSVKQGIEYILSRPELRKAVFGLMSKAFGLIPGIGPLLSIVLDEIAEKGSFDLQGFLSEVFKMGAGKFFQFVAMKALGKVLPANIPPKALAFINKGAKAVADKVGRAGAVGALQAIGVKEKKIDAETEKAVKEVEKMTGGGKKGGSRKSGYIASLITGKNKPMELSKFVKQSDAFKTYTLPQLIKEGVVKMDTEESRNLADIFFTKAGKLRKDTDLGRLIGEFSAPDPRVISQLVELFKEYSFLFDIDGMVDAYGTKTAKKQIEKVSGAYAKLRNDAIEKLQKIGVNIEDDVYDDNVIDGMALGNIGLSYNDERIRVVDRGDWNDFLKGWRKDLPKDKKKIDGLLKKLGI